MYLNIISNEEIILVYNPKKKLFENRIGQYYVLKNGIYLIINSRYEVKKMLVQGGKYVLLEWQGAIPGDVALKLNELKREKDFEN